MNLYLREINANDEKELLEMVDEINNDIIIDKFEGFRNIEGLTHNNYNDFLDELQRNKNMKLYKPDFVDQTTFVLVDADNHVYGGTNIRHELNDNLFQFGGNIGYLIRPSERKKGYGTLILHLALLECKKIGIFNVLITCREYNIGSARVIEKNNGVFENSLLNPKKNIVYKRYWINNS